MLMGFAVFTVIFTLLFLPAFLQVNAGIDAYGILLNRLERLLPSNPVFRAIVCLALIVTCLVIVGHIEYLDRQMGVL